MTKVSPPTYSHIVLPGCTHKIQKCVLISSYLCVSSHWLLVNMFVHILQAGPKYGRFKNMIWGCKLFEIFSSSCFMSHALAWPGDRAVHCRALHCPGDIHTSCNLLNSPNILNIGQAIGHTIRQYLSRKKSSMKCTNAFVRKLLTLLKQQLKNFKPSWWQPHYATTHWLLVIQLKKSRIGRCC